MGNYRILKGKDGIGGGVIKKQLRFGVRAPKNFLKAAPFPFAINVANVLFSAPLLYLKSMNKWHFLNVICELLWLAGHICFIE